MDYARAVVEFFVERRGKGAAISSTDEQRLFDWELQGIPLGVVFRGVDDAFERKTKPPRSLTECGRWVKAAFKKWGDGDTLDTTARAPDEGASARASAPSGVDTTPRAPVDEALARLAKLEQSPLLAGAAANVSAELRELIAEGGVDDSVLFVLDEAVADAACAALPAARRAEVVAQAERALRGRTMSASGWAAARAREVIALLSAAG